MSELVRRLPELAPEWRFLLLRSDEHPSPLSLAENVTEIELQAPANGPASMWFLPQLINFRGVDLFHSPSNILPARVPTRCVTTIHDLMWLNQPELCNGSAWGRVERLFYQHGIKRALRRSHAIATVSDATRRDIAAHDPQAAQRTTVLYPSASASFAPGQPDPTHLQALGLGDLRYVLTVGQNAPYKNHAAAIEAFAHAFDPSENIHLVLVQRRAAGSSDLDRISRQLGVAERVHFVEQIEDTALVSLYRGAFALLHPSFIEGYGIPLVEAMAVGCPVITSDRSAMSEVTAGAALLADPNSPDTFAKALRRLLVEPQLAATFKEKGLERAGQLSWDRFAQGHIDLYRRVLEAS